MWNSFTATAVRVRGGPLLSPSIFNTTESSYRELSKWQLDYTVFGFKEDLLSDKASIPEKDSCGSEVMDKKAERGSRRRPTYSAKFTRAFSRGSEDTCESSDADEIMETANDIRMKRISEFHKSLTKTVKLKSGIFHERVCITCSKDGKTIEWYKIKGKEVDKEKGPIGEISVGKILTVKTKADNLKHLEILCRSEAFLFMFKTTADREEWQTELENFIKFMRLP
ncbi:conserved hypothetical protein [Theileria equi strain WA]|uniref:PH domain-containing protein n=1 Tax=Theileria equi strain WA TaxID=1537102 RepID=L1LFN5_THEEQ|nr:conserved hypothetical protein [Theileria equi strain WA]EKX74166.1 conserved hypothetical protein [Theileria equi strain WA]|eukprot:XP_004833618.1 conserved hypothetical protein [Theileria equi strain WA]